MMTILEIMNERKALINRKKIETDNRIRQAEEEGDHREILRLKLEFNDYVEMMWSDMNGSD